MPNASIPISHPLYQARIDRVNTLVNRLRDQPLNATFPVFVYPYRQIVLTFLQVKRLKTVQDIRQPINVNRYQRFWNPIENKRQHRRIFERILPPIRHYLNLFV